MSYVNANDGTCEGVDYRDCPAASPCSSTRRPAPARWIRSSCSTSFMQTDGRRQVHAAKNKNIKKVLVIGSGPIVIGQAAEFDYAGTQACRALKEEGLEVVLVNSNPATIMTDNAIGGRNLH